MANSVVIFGMAHSGKSTCCGYIYNELNKGKKGYDFELFVEKMRGTLGGNYDPSRDYGYLLDKGLDEIYRTNAGTSKRMHLKRVRYRDLNFTIIDTPGAQHRENQRHRGMFYGDVGVFCIEIEKILDERLYTNKKLFASLISTLVLWSKYKKATIIALTKMDVCNYSEEDYKKAKAIIMNLCNALNVSKVVPIAINVKQRKGHNIFEKSALMPWYTDKSLMDIINEEIVKVKKEKEEDKLLFTVDRSYMQPKQRTGKCWRIKILAGHIEVGKKIVLAPVVVNGEWTEVTAVIKSIRSDFSSVDGVEKIEYASEGSIVGIDLSDIYAGRKKLSKSDMDAVKTSLGFDTNSKYIITDEITFCTDFLNLNKLEVNRQMDLLWYGRSIVFKITEKNIVERGALIKGKIINRKIAIPTNEKGEFSNTNLVIRYDGNMNTNPFIDATLVN